MSKQYIYGYEDLGHLGRFPILANHALVFMIRGIRRTWKQIIAYYFTANSVTSLSLKKLIVLLICELQKLGFKVVCTVCDQGSTNQRALKELCQDNVDKASPFHFIVNSEPIAVIFDVPHLLKNTRNALIGNVIQFESHKEVKFEYIERIFNVDQEKRFKTLPKLKKQHFNFKDSFMLKKQHFNFKDSFMKMKVKVAASQLSSSVAAAIETYVSTNVLPSEAIHTAHCP
ncbi:hypothetical protein J437_LFUL015123 [Ladona fulva]|uniref:Transposase n=1 Tax=Ladona fulva TaxID=123851 RepID=A0A8K0KCX2_LADFU|nr:hypothetical protein J437_LFUL015123 [Ladona fulva]